MNTHQSKQQQMLDHTIYRVPSSFDITQQFQVGNLEDFTLVRPEPATMVPSVDYILEWLLPLIWRTHNVDNSAGTFDRIMFQACVPILYFIIQYVNPFVVKCKLRNIPSKRTAAVVVVVVVIAIVIAFNVGINEVTTAFGFEGFKKFLGDASRWCDNVRWADIDYMWITTNAVVEMIKLNGLVMSL